MQSPFVAYYGKGDFLKDYRHSVVLSLCDGIFVKASHRVTGYRAQRTKVIIEVINALNEACMLLSINKPELFCRRIGSLKLLAFQIVNLKVVLLRQRLPTPQ